MKISHMFKTKKCVFSIEVFPPKKYTESPKSMFAVLQAIARLQPDFISVTYGAGGSAATQSTCSIASYIKNELNIESLAHLTCINLTKEQLNQVIPLLQKNKIENILALRGDIIPGVAKKKDFAFASDLAAQLAKEKNFGISGACYPEGHVECANLQQDVKNLHYKIDAGVSHLITQLFFDNVYFYRFLNMARKKNYTLPIQAGVMPIVNENQINRTIALSSASLPSKFTKIISKYSRDPTSLYHAGIDYAINQIRDLIIGGADGIHLYAMNNPKVVEEIYYGISDLLNR